MRDPCHYPLCYWNTVQLVHLVDHNRFTVRRTEAVPECICETSSAIIRLKRLVLAVPYRFTNGYESPAFPVLVA
jgi:hypothetical protein